MPRFISTGKPVANARSHIELSRFKGVDLTSGAVNVSPARSPSAPNIMPDDDGFPIKRCGWQTVEKYFGVIYGVHCLIKNGETKRLVHAGEFLEYGGERIYNNMAKAFSCSVQLGGKLWILDSKNYLYFDGEKIGQVSDIATVPIITIAKAPNGETSATAYKPVNLLTTRRTESFLGNDKDKAYQLSFSSISGENVRVSILQENGIWKTRSLNDNYSVETAAGRVIFTFPIGASPVTGEDNVRISYDVLQSGVEKISKCRFSILYGVEGGLDRIFLGGNPEQPNIDHWSEWNDPAYIGDIFYSVLGQEASPIVGYSVVNDKLVTHKSNEENGRNVFVRQGELNTEGFAGFPIKQVLQGEGAVSSRSVATINGEPLFLTNRGVYTLTPGDVTGERYVQCRSYYINGGLLKEGNLAQASAARWGRFYVLAAGDKLYLLDGEQKNYNEKSPHSTYQYEGYYWTGIGATSIWVEGEKLYFGTKNGEIRMFLPGGTSANYMDDNKAVECFWSTPLLNLGNWNRYKTVTGMWVVGQPYTRSSGSIYYATDIEYERHAGDYKVDVFNWDDINFDRWTFNILNRPAIKPGGRRAKKIKLFQVKIKNDKPHEAFGIYAVHIEFRQGGRIR